ncbi:MAG: response regulator [Desulfuromonadales bacterium]|nr:response regulator [Desulfuromonadales bacterium]
MIPKILIVDDIQDNLTTLKAVISDAFPGANILTALSGARGIELALAEDPDVILLDIIMPGMDGFEACRRMKADERLLHIPVVFLTARLTDRESRIKALESGAEAFLSKPLEEAELTAQIRAMIKIKAAAEAQRQEKDRLAAMVVERTRELDRELAEHRKAEEALRESEERYRTLMESVPALIYRFSTTRGGLFYSPQVETVFGFPLRNFYDNPMLWRDSIHPDDYDRVMNSICSFDADGTDGFDIEYRIRSRSGDWVWLNDRSVRRVKIHGDVIIDGIAQDISARKKAEGERQEIERQFQQAQKLESLGVLAGGIAHDFNNILTIILGHCYMAKDAHISELPRETHLQHIEDAAHRAALLCHQMLAYAGKRTLFQTRIKFRLLLKDMVKMLQSAISKSVSIRLDLGSDDPEIMGDHAQIQQIVMNLIINAADAIGDVNGTIRIGLAVRDGHAAPVGNDFFGNVIPAGSYACLEVSDSGCGMDDETQRRIFEPFFTTKFTGRGLGMSAILGIIKSHNGALQLSSSPGCGTNFKIYFPLCAVFRDVVTDTAAETSHRAQPGGDVLLVDDEQALRTIGTSMLKSMGFSAITACNGREALEIYRTRGSGIDLVLLDMIMPEMGGVEAYHEFRKLSPKIPVVICSGYNVEGLSIDIDTDAYAGCVQKPFRPDQLRDVMMKVLAVKSLESSETL